LVQDILEPLITLLNYNPKKLHRIIVINHSDILKQFNFVNGMTTPPLLAILLITSSYLTSPSKRLLFHYPPHPNPQSSPDEEILDDTSSDASSTSASSLSTTSTTTSFPSSKFSRLTGDNNNRYTIEEDEERHGGFDRDEDDDRTSSLHWRRKQSRITEWEQPLFGLSKKDLAELLTPKDSLCNRKFELGVEDLVFLGHPTYLTNDDTTTNTTTTMPLLAASPSSSINDDVDTEVIISKVKLGKFHIVFVMNPSWRLDYHEHVQKMYVQVVKRFTDACTMEQQERGYISLEAFKIHKIIKDAEEKGSILIISSFMVELPMSMVWEELIQTSNLAHSISTLYNSIIHNKVAFIDLNNSIEMAFHIKQISQISSLPELGTNPFNEKNIPLLSSAHGFGEREDEADQVLAPKYTLLLMDTPDEILKKVPSRPPHRRQNWIKFLRSIKPNST
jgi:Nitrogen Permease regulator of amino acid transport activity 3